MLTLKKSHVVIAALLLVVLSITATKLWLDRYYPIRPVFVEVYNDTKKVIPSVIIEHGNDALMEKMTIVNLRPKEKRIIALNHQPGLGFNVHVNYANGEETEICGGKTKGYWFYRETILDVGIYTTPLR